MPQTFCHITLQVAASGAPRAWPQLSLCSSSLLHCRNVASAIAVGTQNAQPSSLSVSSFVFDWIKLPCLVRVLVPLPSLPPSLPQTDFSVSCPCRSVVHCMLSQCTHSFIFMSWQLPVVVSTRTCQDASLAQCLTQSYWSSGIAGEESAAN